MSTSVASPVPSQGTSTTSDFGQQRAGPLVAGHPHRLVEVGAPDQDGVAPLPAVRRHRQLRPVGVGQRPGGGRPRRRCGAGRPAPPPWPSTVRSARTAARPARRLVDIPSAQSGFSMTSTPRPGGGGHFRRLAADDHHQRAAARWPWPRPRRGPPAAGRRAGPASSAPRRRSGCPGPAASTITPTRCVIQSPPANRSASADPSAPAGRRPVRSRWPVSTRPRPPGRSRRGCRSWRRRSARRRGPRGRRGPGAPCGRRPRS